ncbi:rabenosyn-5 [Monomorium pharaonis]|uniref:rabenosyn-5 n=1 Tax=Monomorium pharaonis TaxID=307658 RepID=UPI00063F1867|nr:rabenosyn-5 [Monomorium pharaonis]
MANNDVLEGFICPICITDFKAPNHLTKHFEEVHNDDPEILRSLKDLFGKAKKKILKQDDIPESFPGEISQDKRRSPEINWGPQEIGAITSHTKYFKDIRNTRLERYAYETNKLLIRLDKLLNNLPSDPVDRKVHERTIVPWIDEKDVKLCPNCAKSFHLARRKHHCRLCGAVMCHNCTVFLSLNDARKMTSPVSIQDDSALSPTSERAFSERMTPMTRRGIGLSKLARSPSNGSLNSVLSLVNDSASSEQHFRICIHCINLLDAREMQKAKQFDKPIVCEFYEKMREYMSEASQHLTMYNKMWESLKEGETTYSLEDAQSLRVKLAKLGENIDITSKRILVLGVKKNTENLMQEALGQELRLYQMVRTSAMIFLKEELLTLQPLPSVEEYTALQEERQKRIEARIAYERQLEEEREKPKESRKKDTWNLDSSSLKTNQAQVIMTQSQGWGPSHITPIMSSSMDPIIEQMSNLRAYIKQARADCKYDEVATLENNLRELQSAYFTMKQSNNDG